MVSSVFAVLSSVALEDSKNSEVSEVCAVSRWDVLCVISESEEDVVVDDSVGLFLPQPAKIKAMQRKNADKIRIKIFFIFI